MHAAVIHGPHIERETAWNWDADWLSRLSNGVYCVVQQVARSLTPMSDVLTRQLHTHFAFNIVYARRTYDYRFPFPAAIAHSQRNWAYCLPVCGVLAGHFPFAHMNNDNEIICIFFSFFSLYFRFNFLSLKWVNMPATNCLLLSWQSFCVVCYECAYLRWSTRFECLVSSCHVQRRKWYAIEWKRAPMRPIGTIKINAVAWNVPKSLLTTSFVVFFGSRGTAAVTNSSTSE